MAASNADEVRAQVQQHHTVLFGVEGEGGLVRQVADHEKRLNSLTLKLMALVFLAAVLGASLGSPAAQALLQTLLP